MYRRTRRVFITLGIVVGAVGVTVADPISTAFTYQGQIKQGGIPLNGTADFVFTLWDAVRAGAQVGPTLTFDGQIRSLPPISVSNGLFTADLDFGTDAFSGDARWLQIAVRSPHTTLPFPYVLLTPRQELTPAPYALFAAKSGNVNTLDQAYDQGGPGSGRTITADAGAVSIEGPDGLHVTGTVSASSVSASSVRASISFGAAGPGLQVRRAISGSFPPPSLRMDIDANRINAYRSAFGTPDVGTALRLNDDSPGDVLIAEGGGAVLIAQGGGDVLIAQGGGNVGIGTTHPGSRLHVVGDAAHTVHAENSSTEVLAVGVYGEINSASPGGASAGVQGVNSSTGVVNYGVWGLHTGSGFGVLGQSSEGTGVWGVSESTGGIGVWGQTSNPDGFAGFFTGGKNYFEGNVGIGTVNPKQSLHNTGDYYGKGHFWLHAYGGDGSDGTAYFQARDDSGTSSIALQLRTQIAGQIVDAMRLTPEGNVGIGTATPGAKLDIKAGGAGAQLLRFSTDRAWVFRQLGSGVGAALELHSFAGEKSFVITAWDGTEMAEFTDRGTLGARVIVPVLQITGGSDLSEQFEVNATEVKAEPGMVVCIDPKNPGQLAVCRNVYDRTVAGVISGAGGVKPGMLMGQHGSLADGEQPVALTGRVYVLADASKGAIQPGDLLTTSDTPGHAMKVADFGKAQGAIIGKAMTSLDEGKGLVLVLVSLQ